MTLLESVAQRIRQVEQSRARFQARAENTGKRDMKAYYLRQIERCNGELIRLQLKLDELKGV